MRLRTSLAVIALFVGACDCGDGGLNRVPDGGMVMERCQDDTDCGDEEICTVGACVSIHECGPDNPCPQPEQICEANASGARRCIFQRCTEDSECQDTSCDPQLVAVCIAGGCTCGEPCEGGCPFGQGCCIPDDTCYDLPPRCEGLTCPVGQFVSVTSSGAWDRRSCAVEDETCQCEVLPPLAVGDIGLHAAMAHDPLTPVISAYNVTYGDLMFGVVQPDFTIDWSFVDGVPTSTDTIGGDIDGPRGGQSAPGPDVGIYTDVAVGPGSDVHIAYQDRGQGSLRYARRDENGWSNHLVDGQGVGDSGRYAALLLRAADDRPVVVYLSDKEEIAGGFRQSVLRLAQANIARPTSASDWSQVDLDTRDLRNADCDERCLPREVCLRNGNTCVVPDDIRDCTNPSCEGNEACINGTCEATRGLPPFRDLSVAPGLWPTIGQLPSGDLLIFHHDRRQRNLVALRIAGPDYTTGAVTRTVIEGDGSADAVGEETGLYADVYVTPGGEIHLVYMNATRKELRYRELDGQFNTLVSEVVESGLTMPNTPEGDDVGADAALVVDSLGSVRVAYQNGTLGSLRYAIRRGGAWESPITLAGDEDPYRGSFGFYNGQVLDEQSNPVVSSYRFFLSAPQGPDNGIELLSPP